MLDNLRFRSVRSVPSLHTWLGHSRKGDQVEYWDGYLVADRFFFMPHANELGAAAYKLYKDGKVSLVQRRLGPSHYSYRAVRL